MVINRSVVNRGNGAESRRKGEKQNGKTWEHIKQSIVIPSKYILVFNIQIRCVKWLKHIYISK